jgi:hypothetical protein
MSRNDPRERERERPCELQMTLVPEQGCPGTLKLTSWQHMHEHKTWSYRLYVAIAVSSLLLTQSFFLPSYMLLEKRMSSLNYHILGGTYHLLWFLQTLTVNTECWLLKNARAVVTTKDSWRWIKCVYIIRWIESFGGQRWTIIVREQNVSLKHLN